MFTGIQILSSLQDIRTSAPELLNSFIQSVCHPVFIVVLPVLVTALVYWCCDKKTGFYLAFTFAAANLASTFLKLMLCVPRPWIIDPAIRPSPEAIAGANGFSCPSSHTTSAAAFFGSVAMILRKYPVVPVLCGVFIALVGFSRMYIGVHTPLDILAGLGLAGFFLWFAWRLMIRLDQYPRTDLRIVLLGVGITLLLTAGVLLRSYPVSDLPVPGMLQFCLCAGWFTGFLPAWLVERRKICFTIPLGLRLKILRGGLGVLLLGILMILFSGFFPAVLGEDAGTFIAYFLLSLFVFAGYPWILKRQEQREPLFDKNRLTFHPKKEK